MIDIVALDPGATIGICSLKDGQYGQQQLVPANYPHPHETLFDLLSKLQPKLIVYERFDYRAAKNGAVLVGVEYIGVIQLYAQIKCISTVQISPSDGKAFWTDKKLKAIDLYRTSMPHAMDATRILLTHQMRSDPIFKEEMLAALRVLIEK